MELIICNNPNDNSSFLIELIAKTEYCKNNGYYWVVSDLDLIPLFHGDYIGNGGGTSEEIAYSFLNAYEKRGIAILSYNELINILRDSQSIRNAVIICFDNQVYIDEDTFRPRVESNNINKLSHDKANMEVRILDGDFFYILKSKQ